MPTPRLLHKTPVYLRRIDRKFTAIMDPNLREPIGQVRREQKPIRLIAQVEIKGMVPRQSEAGVVEKADGYMLFRTQDLRDEDVVLERGHRVVQIGDPPNDREVDYYITKIEHKAHYANHGGPTLVKAYFEDREPSRRRGDL